MNKLSLHYLGCSAKSAKVLAALLKIPAHEIKIHTFPDNESKLSITPVQGTAIVFASLNNPNEKLLHIALAASALKDNGANRLVLVAPYLCYMRQDKAFKSGEAVSQRVIGELLANHFDRVITVDPHLHRTPDLHLVFPNCDVDSLKATDPLADALNQNFSSNKSILVAPDIEAEQWVSAISDKTNIPYMVAEKKRKGDREISIKLPQNNIEGMEVIIVDDVISSGMTIVECAKALKLHGAHKIYVAATHMVCQDEVLSMLAQAGVSRVFSTDSIEHSTNAVSLAPLLADTLSEEC